MARVDGQRGLRRPLALFLERQPTHANNQAMVCAGVQRSIGAHRTNRILRNIMILKRRKGTKAETHQLARDDQGVGGHGLSLSFGEGAKIQLVLLQPRMCLEHGPRRRFSKSRPPARDPPQAPPPGPPRAPPAAADPRVRAPPPPPSPPRTPPRRVGAVDHRHNNNDIYNVEGRAEGGEGWEASHRGVRGGVPVCGAAGGGGCVRAGPPGCWRGGRRGGPGRMRRCRRSSCVAAVWGGRPRSASGHGEPRQWCVLLAPCRRELPCGAARRRQGAHGVLDE